MGVPIIRIIIYWCSPFLGNTDVSRNRHLPWAASEGKGHAMVRFQLRPPQNKVKGLGDRLLPSVPCLLVQGDDHAITTGSQVP